MALACTDEATAVVDEKFVMIPTDPPEANVKLPLNVEPFVTVKADTVIR